MNSHPRQLPWPLVEKTRYGSVLRAWRCGRVESILSLDLRVASVEYVRRRIAADIRAVRSASSHHIATIVSVFIYGASNAYPPQLCVVTESFELGTVRDALDANKNLSASSRTALALDAARGICAFQSATKSLHMHVRCGSFVITSAWRVKVVTPTLSRYTACHRKNGRALVPAAAYTSPQLLGNNFLRYRLEDEIFSLGVVLWEIVTGLDPFAGMTPLEIIAAVLGGAVEPVSSSCPPRVEEIINACRSHSPSARPPVTAIVGVLHTALG